MPRVFRMDCAGLSVIVEKMRRALFTIPAIFLRECIIPSVAVFLSISTSVHIATFLKSKPSNTCLKTSRFLSIRLQLRPQDMFSMSRYSKSFRSSWTGTPHSLSW